MSHQEYARQYIWNRFKYSALTLAGVLLPSLASLGMMFADWPWNLQVFNIIALVSIVGISYWWHWFYNVEALAEMGVSDYMQQQETQRRDALRHTYETMELSAYPAYDALKIDLQYQYDAFRNALSKQKIIAANSRTHFESKAAQAFESGVALLSEINDILVVQASVPIERIKEQLAQHPAAGEKEQLLEVFDAYRQNEAKLERLSKSLRALTHSYVLAISRLAALTSKTHEKEDFETSELQEAIDAAKAVQEKLHSLSSHSGSELEAIKARYSSPSKEQT